MTRHIIIQLDILSCDLTYYHMTRHKHSFHPVFSRKQNFWMALAFWDSKLLGLRGWHTRAIIMVRPDPQDLFTATFPDIVSCFPHSEHCFCQSALSSSDSLHCLVHSSKGILQCAFTIMALGLTCRIQRHCFLVAVDWHLDGAKDVNSSCNELQSIRYSPFQQDCWSQSLL